MRRPFKNRIAVAVVALLMLCALFLCACDAPREVDRSWTIENMTVTVDVAADRTATVEERLTVVFNEYFKHGIIRDLAINSGERYRDVGVRQVFDTDERAVEYSFEHENGFLSLWIGSEDETQPVGKPIEYVINYTLIAPKTDDMTYYMNVIATSFTTDIESATARMTLPYPIDKDKAFFYQGVWGERGRPVGDPVYSDDDRTVTVTAENLQPYEGLTFDLTMNGTFDGHFEWQTLVIIVGGLFAAGLAVLLVSTVGRDKPIVPITNYYPPKLDGKKLTPVEMGTLIDGKCDDDDVTAMLFYWASQGYLRLKDENGDMEITFVAPLDEDAPAYQKKLFNAIYRLASPPENGDEVDYTRVVRTDALQEKMYGAVSKVKSDVQDEYKGKLYDGRARGFSLLAAAVSLLFTAAVVFFAYLRVSARYFSPVTLMTIFPVVLVYAAGLGYVYVERKLAPKKRALGKIGLSVLALVASAFPMFFAGSFAFTLAEKILLAAFGGSAALVAPFINRRTPYYTEVLGEIEGFKEFLTLAEKDRLEMLLEENPQYYYDVLPYANVLGVSDIWQDKFKDLTVPPPTYWNSDTFGGLILFNGYYRGWSRSVASTLRSRPQAASSSGRSGGGFSGGRGGGFSGGGFGGGGGRSW